MIVVGLTGSIGMGKTTAARQLRRLGLPVFAADEAVHRLIGPGGAAVSIIESAFPGIVTGTPAAVDRGRLSARVFGDKNALRRLESLLHPLVRWEERRFLQNCRRQGRPIAVLDIPLLYETGAERFVDAVVVVSCPAFLQQQRVLARPGMTAEKFAAIRDRQMDDGKKRRRADFLVPTGLGRRFTLCHLKRGIARLQSVVSRHRSTKVAF